MHSMEDTINGHISFAAFNPKTDERQADVIGMTYAVDAGYQADGLLNALEKLAAHDYPRYGARALLGGQTPPVAEFCLHPNETRAADLRVLSPVRMATSGSPSATVTELDDLCPRLRSNDSDC